MERVFVDTSAWFAYANKSDRDHGRVRTVMQSFEGRLVTSNFVFGETVTLCLYRLGHHSASQVGDILQRSPEIDLVSLTSGDERAAWALFLDRPDKTYSYTDCTSFVLMRRLGLGTSIALDDDFRREGFALLPAP